ncbi:MAG TPA: CaiB/BaiF CoA-transferase family protein [Paracoccaceae bacterium]|nr:CaiB/BaiF CoA-transferase family protein [Paracoccaceae bacterium]
MGALDGVRVIDLTRVLGGPFCTQWLGDHGAEIIKIEPPQGDEVRHWGPPFDEEVGAASYFLGINRNKRGMALDLGTETGREVLRRLLATADVLIENFKPGGMEKWGLGYDALEQEFPRLIHCRISGFGADGPLGGLPGYDAVIQAQSGLMSVNGEAGRQPIRLGVPIVDIATGMSAGFGICMALYEREKSGKGQYIDMTLYDTAVSMLFPHYANYFLAGTRPKLTGNNHPNLSPYDVYQTRTCNIFIAGGNQGQFRRMCEVLGAPQAVDDPKFRSNSNRVQHQAELRQLFEPLMAEWDGEELARTLMARGVPAGAVLETPEAIDSPHTRHRKMAVQVGDFRTTGNPIKFSRTPARPDARKPPKFGGETRKVLAEIGYAEDEIEAMIAAGAALEKVRN